LLLHVIAEMVQHGNVPVTSLIAGLPPF